ncbi:MAG: molybdenum cofactor guanylyltransferase [Pseudohongiellaceae bacterium]
MKSSPAEDSGVSPSEPAAAAPRPLLGVVLAGGRSSRMGRDKAELPWQGQTLLDHTLALLARLQPVCLRVSGRAHALGIADLHPLSGPPGAVLSVLEWLHARGELDGRALLLLPVDMPLLQEATLQRLLAAVRPGRAACFRQQVFPCVLPASPALLHHLRALFAEGSTPGGRRSLRALLTFSAVLEVDEAGVDPAEFSNVNTPEDWQRLLGGVRA